MSKNLEYTVADLPEFGIPDIDLGNIKPLPKKTADQLADELREKVGDLSSIKHIYPTKVLCAVYVRETVGAGLILAANETQREDVYQGKAFLIMALGSAAYVNQGDVDFFGYAPKVGDWVAARPADGEHLKINGEDFRLFDDRDIRMVIDHPDCVY